MDKYTPSGDDLIKPVMCRSNAYCGVNLNSPYMSFYFSRFRGMPSYMQTEIGYWNYDDDQLTDSDAVATAVEATKAALAKSVGSSQQIPILWMPSKSADMLELYEKDWNESQGYLYASRVMLLFG